MRVDSLGFRARGSGSTLLGVPIIRIIVNSLLERIIGIPGLGKLAY